MKPVTVNDLLSSLILRTEQGKVLLGGYKEVWSQLGQSPDRWCHFRASHLAAAGRKWEALYSRSFATLCPELPAHADQWVGRSL